MCIIIYYTSLVHPHMGVRLILYIITLISWASQYQQSPSNSTRDRHRIVPHYWSWGLELGSGEFGACGHMTDQLHSVLLRLHVILVESNVCIISPQIAGTATAENRMLMAMLVTTITALPLTKQQLIFYQWLEGSRNSARITYTSSGLLCLHFLSEESIGVGIMNDETTVRKVECSCIVLMCMLYNSSECI